MSNSVLEQVEQDRKATREKQLLEYYSILAQTDVDATARKQLSKYMEQLGQGMEDAQTAQKLIEKYRGIMRGLTALYGSDIEGEIVQGEALVQRLMDELSVARQTLGDAKARRDERDRLQLSARIWKERHPQMWAAAERSMG
jgi:hypothetical protein